MTSQKDQIQRLITEIEATLAKPTPRLPLGLSSEAERQRQLLGKLFSYLQSLEQMFDAPGGWGPIDPGTGQLVSSQVSSKSQDIEESASQVLQGLLQEMQYLRENSLKPMRQELELLRQRRDSLQAELNDMEAQRTFDPVQSEKQITDFLEVLMQRLQVQLSAQMVQSFAVMESTAVEQLSSSGNPVPLLSGQRLEQVRLLQAQSDELLLKLDSTLTAVFGSLQKSVDSYRESLEEGLDQMHGLGRQGEVIFHAFINHLAQQLGQDASSYLTGELGFAGQQTSLQDSEVETAEVDLQAVQPNELDQVLDDLVLGVDDAGDTVESNLEIDPDLFLLEDEVAPVDIDEDITLIQSDGMSDSESELAQIEDEIALEDIDIDEDITLIQSDSASSQETDLEEETTLIQNDDKSSVLEVDSELALLEDAISSSDLGIEYLSDVEDEALEEVTLDELSIQNDASAASDLVELPTSFDLDSALGAIDESLSLLDIGHDNNDLSGGSQINSDITDLDVLPREESEVELFNINSDLHVEPQSLVEESVDLSDEEPLDADRSVASEESSNEALFFDPSDVDGESTQT
ncbi:MAG: hypothetical protein F6K11_02745, partial [Leptolyngbya sp. SIO3F4]|nr:hypothetical protein [Leptolyngbya sp. SIO3F4]